ncbi:hypothetical protein E3N88_27194 [Mikania micrantha]|uniref:Uncharacterized protein n=1 Tax=Mikania micrantha TaxID=192012 RepID=A0A5N6MVY8_9ASTR|nr:hypothetical protein E3N88_27194 [Mikania micrantha]
MSYSHGQEWAQNNKIGILGLTYGPGGTPDPKLPSQAMRADEEDGASSGAPAHHHFTYLNHFKHSYTPLIRLISIRTPYYHHFHSRTSIVEAHLEGLKTQEVKRSTQPLLAPVVAVPEALRGVLVIISTI